MNREEKMKLPFLIALTGSLSLTLASSSVAQVSKLKPKPTVQIDTPNKTSPRKPTVKVPPKRRGQSGPSVGPISVNPDDLYNAGRNSKRSQQIMTVCRYDYNLGVYDYKPHTGQDAAYSAYESIFLTGRNSKADSYEIKDEAFLRGQSVKPLENAILRVDDNPDYPFAEAYPVEGSVYMTLSAAKLNWITKAIDERKGVCVGVSFKSGDVPAHSVPDKVTNVYIWTSAACRCR
jgi:hypothetical protein